VLYGLELLGHQQGKYHYHCHSDTLEAEAYAERAPSPFAIGKQRFTEDGLILCQYHDVSPRNAAI
jgi:hypothetical protein